MAISQDIVTRAVSTWVFQNVWNQPEDENSVYLRLHPVGERFLTNSIITGTRSIPLPVAGTQYGVFWIDYVLMDDTLIIQPNTWVSTDVLGNRLRTFFHVYSETGLMLPKNKVFVYHATHSRRVYIAVVKNPLVKIVDTANWNTLYIGIYHYTAQNPSPISITSYQVATPDTTHASAGAIQAAINTAAATVPHGTFVYINGYDHIPTSTITLLPGDYVDVYTDTTVIGSYTVNLSDVVTGYLSTFYGNVYKEVIHCPKASNPNKLIMTTELLTLTARRNSDNVGCFLHHNEPNGITQITHCDIGINTDIINAYRTSLGTADISVEVRMRSHGLTLVRDKQFIDYLYVCSDTTILSFLVGHGDPSLPFWTAASLEQSAYVGYMSTPPVTVNPETLTTYINGLGYYTVMAAICHHDRFFTIDEVPVTDISVRKPLILAGQQTYPLVYLDGYKVRDTQVDYTNSRHNNILFSFTPDIYATIGQSLVVELIESGSSTPYLFTPTSGTHTLTVPFPGVTIYQVNTLTSEVIAYNATSLNSYTKVNPGPGQIVQVANTIAGETTLTFQPSAYGVLYLVQNTSFSRVYGLDITSQVVAITPIHIELMTLCNDGSTIAPLIGYNTLAVYVNGLRMIEGIDFSANPMTDPDGNISIVQVLILNRSALNLTGSNYLEVIAHTGVPLIHAVGYATNNQLSIQNNVEAWYSGLTTAYAGGKLLINPTDAGDAIIPTTTVGNGVPFQLTAEVPSFAADVLTGFNTTADDIRISLINNYLDQQPPFNDISTLIIPKSWQVFSPFLTAIIHDASQAGTVQLYTIDPDTALFKQQFAAYNYLLLNDPTVDPTEQTIDLRYCDIFPCYSRVTVPDMGTYSALHYLAGLLLPPDSDTLGEVLDA